MEQFVVVAEDETSVPVELPSEDDGTLLLSTLSAQFPGACGLQYKSVNTGALRGTRLANGRFDPPDGEWRDQVFYIVYSKDNKRKGDDGIENPVPKTKKFEKLKCNDLIVLGLPWECTEDDLRTYFNQFGELSLVQIKKDPNSGKSKGFGFICFVDYESQLRCLDQRHMIGNRWCDVRIPNSKLNDGPGYSQNQKNNRKIFIGHVSDDITEDDLRTHFSKYGDISDVFIPKPFRGFAFITFSEADVAMSLCGEDHIIAGTTVHIRGAAPKTMHKFDKGGTQQGNNSLGFGSTSPWAGGNSGKNVASNMMGNNPNMGNNMGVGNMAANPLNLLSSAFQLNPAMVAAAQAALTQAANQAGGWGNVMGNMSQNPQGGDSGTQTSFQGSNPNWNSQGQQDGSGGPNNWNGNKQNWN